MCEMSTVLTLSVYVTVSTLSLQTSNSSFIALENKTSNLISHAYYSSSDKGSQRLKVLASLSLWEQLPDLMLIPGLLSGPIMVNVFPEPVCPYAIRQTLYPSTQEAMIPLVSLKIYKLTITVRASS